DEMDDTGKEHDVVHTNHSQAIIQLEEKLGIGASDASDASTNQILVKQANGQTNWAAVPSSTPTAITVADTTDTTCSVALFESATGDLAPKTDAGVTYNAGTGTLTATAFAGALTGNASGTAATVTGAAQTAITSVGTLSALTVSGAITAGSLVAPIAINAQTGTTYTFVAADAGKLVTSSNGSAQTITIPPNSSVAFAIGTQIMVQNIGSANATLAQGSGVTIQSKDSAKEISGQFAAATCIKTATDTWSLIGALA
ncbi:MAG: hypothetical protein CL504_02365, partial [Actinobacteria bacterium]|nr:hypothetical protein [Actinomycetota bacterium]